MKLKLLSLLLTLSLFSCSEEKEFFSLFNYGYSAFEVYESPIDQSISHQLTFYLTDYEMTWTEDENCFYCPECSIRLLANLIGEGASVKSTEYYLEYGQGNPSVSFYTEENGELANLYRMDYGGRITVIDQSPYFEVTIDANFYHMEDGAIVDMKYINETLKTTFIVLPTLGNALCDG